MTEEIRKNVESLIGALHKLEIAKNSRDNLYNTYFYNKTVYGLCSLMDYIPCDKHKLRRFLYKELNDPNKNFYHYWWPCLQGETKEIVLENIQIRIDFLKEVLNRYPVAE